MPERHLFESRLAKDRQNAAGRPEKALARLAARVRRRRSAEARAGHDAPVRFLLHVRDRRQHDALQRRRHRRRVHEDARRFLERHAHAGHRGNARRIRPAGDDEHIGIDLAA